MGTFIHALKVFIKNGSTNFRIVIEEVDFHFAKICKSLFIPEEVGSSIRESIENFYCSLVGSKNFILGLKKSSPTIEWSWNFHSVWSVMLSIAKKLYRIFLLHYHKVLEVLLPLEIFFARWSRLGCWMKVGKWNWVGSPVDWCHKKFFILALGDWMSRNHRRSIAIKFQKFASTNLGFGLLKVHNRLKRQRSNEVRSFNSQLGGRKKFSVDWIKLSDGEKIFLLHVSTHSQKIFCNHPIALSGSITRSECSSTEFWSLGVSCVLKSWSRVHPLDNHWTNKTFL